jgi:SNF2 family DNA or RNA helicase
MEPNPLYDGFVFKEHQKYAIQWMLKKEEEGSGGILCDEMGLGKTIEMLGLISTSNLKTTLLVLPVAVIAQWKDIAIKSKINVMLYNNSWTLSNKPFLNRPFLFIIGYESLSSNIKKIEHIEFDRLICDEAHRLGVPNILKKIVKHKVDKLNFKTIRQIESTKKWFLTATPIVNSEDDLNTLFVLLGADLIKEDIKDLMAKYALARSMEQIRATMPEAPKKAIINTHKIKFRSDSEEEFYLKIQTSVERQLRFGAIGAKGLKLISILRQVSIHPQVYIHSLQKRYPNNHFPPWKGDSSKFLKIKELLNFESNKEHKWIIFCQFHEEMNLLHDFLEPLPFIRKIELYSGKLNQEQKTETLDAIRVPFEEGHPKCDVLLIQLKSGGVGLNLQEFDRIIFCSPWWTQSSINQGIGRAVRIGQTKQVVVHHLILQQEENVLENNIEIRNIDLRMRLKAEQKEILNEEYLSLADNTIKVPSTPSKK